MFDALQVEVESETCIIAKMYFTRSLAAIVNLHKVVVKFKFK